MSTTITALQFDKFGDYKEVLYVNKNATKPKIAKDTDVCPIVNTSYGTPHSATKTLLLMVTQMCMTRATNS